jgi:hypothetical protein
MLLHPSKPHCAFSSPGKLPTRLKIGRDSNSGLIGSLARGIAELDPSSKELQQARNILIRK